MTFSALRAPLARAVSLRAFTPPRHILGRALALALAVTMGFAPMAEAQSRYATPSLKIRNDRGGLIQPRVDEIAALRATDARVDLGGSVCLSSCTMYLSLPNACVHRGTTFGFHGPSSYGRPLPPQDFEYWSQVMAQHIPASLRSWYLTKARYEITSYYKVSGAELIRLGVAECGATSS